MRKKIKMRYVNLDKTLPIEQYQHEILNGLKEIGEEIAALYYDGVIILKSNLTSKSYLLAHIAREIEGGIRDIFASSKKKEIQECPQCCNKIKQSNHIDEICEVLGVKKDDEFANKWHEIAENFHRFAHRHGPWKSPREKEAFDDLWKQFEQILLRLVGKYFSLLTLIDQVLKKDKPTIEIIETLDNLLQNEARKRYFFKKLTSPLWFGDLLKRGYFSSEKAPGPKPADKEGYYTIPEWNVLPYLEKVSQQVNTPGNEKYIDELLKIIKEVTNYKDDKGQHIDNFRTWWYFVKILCNLPNEKITDDIIELIPIWLESKFGVDLPGSEIVNNLLPKFLNSNNKADFKKAERIIDIVTQIRWVPRYTEAQKEDIREKYKHIYEKPEDQRTEEEKIQITIFDLDAEEAKTIIDTYWLIESFINKKNAIKAGEKCSVNVILNLAKKLKKIFVRKYKSKKADYSYICFRSMFEVPQYLTQTEEVLTIILRNIILAKAKARVDEKATNNIISKFLSEPYPLFTRFVLFIVGREWDKYRDIFWELLEKDKEGNFLNDSHYEPEVYTILQKNVSRFKREEKEKIKNIIEGRVPKKPHPEEQYREFYEAYQRQKWYSAVKDDEYFKPFYEKYKNITKREEKIGFKKQEVRVGPGPSPLSKESILNMSNKELAVYLKEFRTKDPWEGPTIGGLSDILRSAVEEKPEKFVEDLTPFLETGYLYVYEILWGLRNVWEKKTPIDWKKLFEFIKHYIEQEEFWQDKYKIEDDIWEANHFWVIGEVGHLISSGTREDAWSFSEEHFQTAKNILFKIIDNLLLDKEIISKQPTGINNFVDYTLNTSLGKVIEALILLALRIKHVKKTDGWEKEIRERYDILLENKIIESYVWFGMYLSIFVDIDEGWTKSKVKEITPEREPLWEAFMEGYLSGSRVYEDLYKLMRPHYENEINYPLKEEIFQDRLVQHICIGYLREYADIKDNKSLFRKLLDKWDFKQINQIIRFFWMQRDSEEQTIREKIINFWQWIYEDRYKGREDLTEDDKKILSELSKLAVFLHEINKEKFEWLILSAYYVHFGFNSSFFIEYLDRLKDKGDKIQTARYIGKIFLKMLDNGTPDYDKEHITSIVEHLFKMDDVETKECASKICNEYGMRGYEFLRSVYEKYKNKKGEQYGRAEDNL